MDARHGGSIPHEEPGLAFHCCVIFIGCCCLTSSTIGITMAALYMSGERPTYKEPGGEREDNSAEMHLVASAVLDAVGAVSDISLLCAVARKVQRLVLAWVVVAPMRGVGQVVIAIMVCVKYHTRSSMVYVDAVFSGIFLMCLVFFANVCFNYYRVVRANKRRLSRAEARWLAGRGRPHPRAQALQQLPSSASWLSHVQSSTTTSVDPQNASERDREHMEGRPVEHNLP